MSYHKYKDKVVKGLAILLASMMILGAIAPVVFADEGTLQEVGENQGNEEDDEEEVPEEVEEDPIQWTIKPYYKSQDYDPTKPESYYTRFNENTLFHNVPYNIKELYYDEARTEKRLFIKIEFTVDEGELTFPRITNLIEGLTIRSEGSSVSMVDRDFIMQIDAMTTKNETTGIDDRQAFVDKYIFVRNGTNKGNATLYVPIKPLMSHMRYNVELKAGVVDIDSNSTTRPNQFESMTWSFNTMAAPSIGEQDIEVQTVVEDYDIDEPIIIYGKFFYASTIEVYFNNTRAYRVRVRENDQGEEYLEAYLPRGRYKLDPGLYSITVENSSQHSKWLYGTLSVVPESNSNIPEEKTTYGTNTEYGTVSGARRSEVIRLDHAEPVKDQILRNQLSGYILQSPIVQVNGSNVSLSNLVVEIPIDMGEYENYKVFRYNEVSRKWEEENQYSINKVDQRAEIITFNTGIFVVVEQKY